MTQEGSHSLIVDEQSLDRMLTRIAHEIVENNDSIENVALVGIIRRGEVLASRLAEKILSFTGFKPKVGSLDISFYRDDFRRNTVTSIDDHGISVLGNLLWGTCKSCTADKHINVHSVVSLDGVCQRLSLNNR